MPLPGGASDKVGNRYEARWTVACMIRVLTGEADSIRLEPPGDDGLGIEFYLTRGNSREFHQVKRQQTGYGRWTLQQLNKNGVLRAFHKHLLDRTARCVFTSMHAADELDELANRARVAVDAQEFARVHCTGKWADTLLKLRGFWNDCTNEEAFDRIRRVSIRTMDEQSLCEALGWRLETVIEGDVDTVEAVLFEFAFDSVHKELHQDD